MELSKKDTKMTQGLAIISMVVLHLFCRKGADVYGTPLLWINDSVPFVYYLGFLAEICVPLYCLCSGYAHYRLGETNGLTIKRNSKRLLKFLINFWIILVIFSIVGLIVKSEDIPVSFTEFLGNVFLYKLSYNGAWWFVATYVLLVSLSFPLFRLVEKANGILLFIIMAGQMLFFWLYDSTIKEAISINPFMSIVATQFVNLVGDVLFSYVSGMLIAKYNVVTFIKKKNIKNIWLLMALLLISVIVCIAEKAIAMPYYAIIVFLVFNSMNKSNAFIKIFDFLGMHSTNIWLVHMFFYLVLFAGLVQNLKYPLFMFIGMMAICTAVSYIINLIYKPIVKITLERKKDEK